ncbi:MAG: hypothetical protein L3J10_10530 [Sulfurimonas sp.]|nr:hypothetical protein [Sulfurimonas sp.]
MEPFIIEIIDTKSFFDYLQSTLVPLIAIITSYIAYRQWKLEKIKLTHDLFEKRFKVYKHFQIYKSKILQSGTCEIKDYQLFVSNTSESIFIFSEDMTKLKRNFEEKGMELWAIEKELESDKWTKEEKSIKINKRLELQKWFIYVDINEVFLKYIKL